MAINIEQFGKDHWSLLAYLETCCTDYSGAIDIRRLRSKNRDGWRQTYATRLKGYFEDKENPALLLPGHDDFDCIDDIEDAGLIKNNGTGIQPIIELTKEGWRISGLLRKHMASGGWCADFTPIIERGSVCSR